MSDVFTVQLGYDVVDKTDGTADVTLNFDVLKNGVDDYYKTKVYYFGLPKSTPNAPFNMLVAVVTRTMQRLVNFRNNKFVDVDPGVGIKLENLTYKTVVDMEEVLVGMLSQLLVFGREHHRYKEK